VRAWFKSQNYDESVAQGRTQLDRELHRLGITSVNQEKLAQRLHFNKLDDLLAALGRNEITQRRIAVALQEELPTKTIFIEKPVFKPAAEQRSSTGILIEGVGNLLTRMAKCCNPTPPAPIVGYITRDRGITIHKQDCTCILRLTGSRSEQILHAKWSK
jgi:GTP pyrophosphokinase